GDDPGGSCDTNPRRRRISGVRERSARLHSETSGKERGTHRGLFSPDPRCGGAESSAADLAPPHHRDAPRPSETERSGLAGGAADRRGQCQLLQESQGAPVFLVPKRPSATTGPGELCSSVRSTAGAHPKLLFVPQVNRSGGASARFDSNRNSSNLQQSSKLAEPRLIA